MDGTLAVLTLGFVLGIEHAFDADHLVAVSALTSENKNVWKSSLVGLFWGLGHTFTLLLVGAFLLYFKIAIPEKIAISLEFTVGLVIVYLGLSVLRKAYLEKKHIHLHTHSGTTHAHFHSHNTSTSHRHYHKPFVVGIFHGLAGSAAIMLLVLSTMNSFTTGIMYILLFGIGSIISMAFMSSILSIPFALAQTRPAEKWIKSITGAASILFGLFIIATSIMSYASI